MMLTNGFPLTEENYYSTEANQHYMSASQFKSFQKCEAAALAEINGEYVRESSTALLVGGYVDAHFSHTLAQYRALHPEIYKRDGSLKAEFVQANEIIQRIERDSFMARFLEGQSQTIKTGMIGGVVFKAKMDSYFPGEMIVDLKVMRDFKPVYVEGAGKMPFVEAWGYDIQGAIYRAVEGNNLPFVIAAATKEPVTDIALIDLPEYLLDAAFAIVEHDAERYAAIKRGEIKPKRCEHCDYCKATKVLTRVLSYDSFILQDTKGEDGEVVE